MYSLGDFELISFLNTCPERIAYLTTQTDTFVDGLQV